MSLIESSNGKKGYDADWQVIKTRLQLDARKKHISPTFYSGSSASPLPGPIAASAAALTQSTKTAAATSPAAAAAPKPRAVNAISTAAGIIKHEGFRGLYRGLSASYLGVSEGVIQWVLYEVSYAILALASPS